MGKYGDVALRATKLVQDGAPRSASDAWETAARAVFHGRLAAQKKGCPRSAYLGLCEEGLVRGVPAAPYTKSVDNKAYAMAAVQLLVRDPGLAEAGPGVLWNRVMNGRAMRANCQMDVVLTLWVHGLVRRA
jgi:hypothetical protein